MVIQTPPPPSPPPTPGVQSEEGIPPPTLHEQRRGEVGETPPPPPPPLPPPIPVVQECSPPALGFKTTQKRMITVNGVPLGEAIKQRRQEKKEKNPQVKRKYQKPEKKPEKKPTKNSKKTTPSLDNNRRIWEYMPKKKAKVDNMEDNPHKEDDQMSTTREEESKCENKQILNVSKPGVCNREVKTTDKMKMTFSSLQNTRKSNISEKIMRFQELVEGDDCVIGSGRCATHNLKIVRVIKKIRVSEPSEGGGISWRVSESTILECPKARIKKPPDYESSLEQIRPDGNTNGNTAINFDFEADHQSERSTNT